MDPSAQSQAHSLASSAVPSSAAPAHRRRSKSIVAENVEYELQLEAFIERLKFLDYLQMDDEKKVEHLTKFDALDMFYAIQNLNREIANAKLENYILINFLEKNDPRLLIGLKQRRTSSMPMRRFTFSSDVGRMSGTTTIAPSRRSLKSMTASIYTSGSQSKKDKADYRLNYHAKTEMAEKVIIEVSRRIKEYEANAMREIKLLMARIEELRITSQETQETIKNFNLHFLRDEADLRYIETAPERQLERKLRKFTSNWLKCARALIATMRLRITSLQESCQQHRGDLITKSDLVGIIGAVDFEQLVIKREQLLTALDEKNAHAQGLKGVSGKASLAMAEEKQLMMSIEDESKRITNKTQDVIKAIAKLEKELKYVEDEHARDMKTLSQLRDHLDHYEAPSVHEYIDKKNEMLTLEKEEKMLQRKITILNMKMNNVLKKCRQSI